MKIRKFIKQASIDTEKTLTITYKEKQCNKVVQIHNTRTMWYYKSNDRVHLSAV